MISINLPSDTEKLLSEKALIADLSLSDYILKLISADLGLRDPSTYKHMAYGELRDEMVKVKRINPPDLVKRLNSLETMMRRYFKKDGLY